MCILADVFPVKKQTHIANKNKMNFLWIQFRQWNKFQDFFLIESLEEAPLTKLSLFLIGKNKKQQSTYKSRLKNMPKALQNLKCTVYLHEKQHLKGIYKKDLSLATLEEIKTILGKKEVMDYKRITIRGGSEKIQMHTHSDINK